ncbi:MAG: bifunctional diaminohydroxyphosphoribosylaminopyrimidine deaminase/5-amino-6-(5-phosphoribosylamino)uracil reductase RibD [Planctomycetota bacterium]|nr:bifunctional diaminohydroxyphosphoribosylaminopyrimidine deaminase/5-amino-6-(5-phosphoribosylamino)uracil reductase RibD [Planctomycetota bacterium]
MPLTDHDAQRLRRAIALARKGRFLVEPNPTVGCVIERDDAGIVGESWHGGYGGPHAEVAALEMAGKAARGATAYVSLAPCGTHGKTPPCTDALLEAGIERVVYATDDPNPLEQSTGVQRLIAAGIEVVGADGELRDEGERLLERFRATLSSDRPWVALKWAMSLDGRIAPRRGTGGAISGLRARRVVHDWRAHCDAVAVGIETVLADDPQLTCRLEGGLPDGREQPLRIVFDAQVRTPVDSRLVAGVDEVSVLIFCGPDADTFRRRALEERGCVVHEIPMRDGLLDLAAALHFLHDDGVRRLLVEGGARLHGSFLRAGLADQVSAFVTPTLLGGTDAVPAVEGTAVASMEEALGLEEVQWRGLGEDVLMQGYVRGG